MIGSETPTVFVVIGPAGSGKSSVSTALAAEFGAALLDKDVVCGRLTEALLEIAGTDPCGRDDNPVYQDRVMDLEYQTLLAVAGDNLRLGRSVVLDAPFGRYLPDAAFLEDNAGDHDWPQAEWVVVRVAVDGEAIRERVAARGLSRDHWKLENWDEFWSRASAVECLWRGVRIVDVDNDRHGFDSAEVIRQTRAQLSDRG
ncbi:AAA family ATPase [Brevibacterium sp. FAM 27836]|uniref:AAA family ATPase n=1 Tax=Brevibacterium sp. FAM 27836 TaxID=3446693 RepID=UPI003F516CFD